MASFTRRGGYSWGTLALVHHHFHGSALDYAGIAFAAALSWFGFPGPGEAALIGAGIAAARGNLDLASVVASGWFGAMAGGVVGWLIGRHGGRRVVLAGRRLRRVRERALERGNHFFERFGWLAVYLTPTWVAGVHDMSTSRFLVANVVCALAWSLTVGLGAYFVGPSIKDVLTDIGVIGGIILAVLFVTVLLVERRRHRRGVGSARR